MTSDRLALALLVCLSLSVIATALVFSVPARRKSEFAPRDEAVSRALIAAGSVALAAMPICWLFGATPGVAAVISLGLGGWVFAWWPLARVWAVRGVAAWSLTLAAGTLYLTWALVWSVGSDLSAAGLVASGVLWLLELFVFLIGLGYAWEYVDVLARRSWSRETDLWDEPDPETLQPGRRTGRPAYLPGAEPFVSLHVPTRHEPPDMVIAGLRRLLQLDYPNFEVVLVDSTLEESLWRPLEEFCADRPGIRFDHVEDESGSKGAALNRALALTDQRAEIIGVVDSDYLLDANFLTDCAALFADPALSFVQTPQDYRGWERAAYPRRLFFSYSYFFDVAQRSRNEHNAATLNGSMGLVRRSALVAAGGWDETSLTEEVELSLRLLRDGGDGLQVDRPYGRGVLPLTFESLKRQRYRWSFGGVHLLKQHWRSLLPGRRTADNRLSSAQRWSFLAAGLAWFADLAGLVFTAFLTAAAIDQLLGSGLVLRRLSGYLVFAVAMLTLLGLVRALAMTRRVGGSTFTEAIGALGIWWALGPTTARASVRALVSRRPVALRTQEVRGDQPVAYAIRANAVEFTLALITGVLGLLMAFQSGAGLRLVGLLLLVQCVGYAAAPINSVAALRSDLPEDLHRWRRFGFKTWGRPARRGGLLIGTAALGTGVFVIVAAPLGSTGGLSELTRVPCANQAVGCLQTPAAEADSQQPAARKDPASELTELTPANPAASPSGTPSRRVSGSASARPSVGPELVVPVPGSPTASPKPQPPSPPKPSSAPSPEPSVPPAPEPTDPPPPEPTDLPTQDPVPSPGEIPAPGDRVVEADAITSPSPTAAPRTGRSRDGRTLGSRADRRANSWSRPGFWFDLGFRRSWR